MSTENILNKSQWIVLQDGRKGTDNQSLGLAEAMRVNYVTHRFSLPLWQRILPAQWMQKAIAAALRQKISTSPVGLIGAGRRASYVLLAAKTLWPDVRTIQIQDPGIAAENFSHLVAPAHDELTGGNVIATLGGLHAVTDEKLSAARAVWQARLAEYPSPRVAVVIGGNNKYVKLNADWIDDLIAKLHKLYTSGHALWITASRRTPQELIARLQRGLPKKNVFFWSGAGENPYLGFLALADCILVTADSVSMISESLYTHKPVALLRVPGEGKKFRRFYDALISGGYAHWFDGGWHITDRPRLDETARVAALLQERINADGAHSRQER